MLVIDDSSTVRRMLSSMLGSEARITVVGTAEDGVDGLEQFRSCSPDVVTLDIEMPKMDGLAMLAELRRIDRSVPVIMVSTLTARGGTATLEALSRGASDYVTKPSNTANPSEAIAHLKRELVPRILALGSRNRSRAGAVAATERGNRAGATGQKVSSLSPTTPIVLRPRPVAAPRLEAVAIASSTGGPNALERIFSELPANLNVPVLVVQHMPPMFTRLLAERLDGLRRLKVVEAEHAMRLEPGTAYIAPGDFHMKVVISDSIQIALNQGPAENSCRPAADVLFRSVAEVYGGRALGVVLTGMGSDGQAGATSLAQRGAEIIAQDEETSVVWGMPGAVCKAGLVSEVLPLAGIARGVSDRVQRLQRPAFPASRPAPAVSTTAPGGPFESIRPTIKAVIR